MNPRLIRVLASQNRELQGLKTIADAAFLLYFAALLTLARSGWDVALGFAIAAALGWVRFTWLRERIEDFYERRCGRTDWRPRPFGSAFVFLSWVCLGSGSSMMTWPPTVRVAVLLAALAGLPTVIVVRDAPYRLHWLLPALVGIAAAVVHGTLTSTEAAGIWEIRVLVLGAVATALAGVGDHLLLTQMLTGPGHAEEGNRV
jgi:hypothetical protein